MQKLIEGVAMAALAAALRQANVPIWVLALMFGAWVAYVVLVGPVSALVTERFRRRGSHARLDLRSGPLTNRQLAQELSNAKNWAVTHLQNREVASDAEQDKLDNDAHEFETKWAKRMEGYADLSDIAAFVTLGTYRPKNLPPLVRGLVFATDNSLNALAARNKKRRNEISEQLDRLDAIARKLENKDDV
jgi:hypothetical protein